MAFLGGDYIVGGVKDAYDSTIGAADHAIDSVKETVAGVGDSVSGAYESVTGGVSPLEVAGGVATRLKEDMFMGVDAALDETAPLRGAIANDASAAFESFQQTGVYEEGAKLAQEAKEFVAPAVDAVTGSETYHAAADLAEKAKDKVVDMFGSDAQASGFDSNIPSGESAAHLNQIKTGPFVSAGLESLNTDSLDSQGNSLPHVGDVHEMGPLGPGHAAAVVEGPAVSEGIKLEVARGSSIERTLINNLIKEQDMSAQEAGRAAHSMVTGLAKEAGMDWRDLNKIVPGAHMEMNMGADGQYHLTHIDATTTGGEAIKMDSSAFDKNVRVIESAPVNEGGVINDAAVKVDAKAITPESLSTGGNVSAEQPAAASATPSAAEAPIPIENVPGRVIPEDIKSMFAGFSPDIRSQILNDSKDIVTQAVQYNVLSREDLAGMQNDHAFSETAQKLLGGEAQVKMVGLGQTERGNEYMLRIQALAETHNKRGELMEALKEVVASNRSDRITA